MNTTLIAQTFGGPGLYGGVTAATQIEGPAHGTLREVVLAILYNVLNFLALAGVVVIVAAGVYLVVSFGKDEAKDRAKKMILYVIIGLLIVLFARFIVGFFLNGAFLA